MQNSRFFGLLMTVAMPQQKCLNYRLPECSIKSTPDYVQNDADINQHVNLNVRLGHCSPMAISLHFERGTQHKKNEKLLKFSELELQAKACQMWD